MFELSEEHAMLRDMLRDFSDNELKEKAAEIDVSMEYPEDSIKKLGDLGIMGVVYPEKYCGAGMDYIAYAIAIEQISRGCAATGDIVSAHHSLCLGPIYYFGSEAQKEKFLPKLCSGEHLGAFAITESSAGSDSGGTQTTAVKKGDRWVLNGTKTFITNAGVADIYAIIAVTDRDAPKGKNLGMFIVEKGTPGFSFGEREKKLGIRATPIAELVLDEVEIPEENILGKPGEGFRIAMHTLDGGRLGIAAQALGIAQAALEEAAKYANERVQFGKPIAKLQSIQNMIADMRTEIEAARLLVYQAGHMMNTLDRRQAGLYTAMAKLYASECAHRCTHKCIQIHGGYGFVSDYIPERLYRDARITEIYEGTSEIQRMVIGSTTLNDYMQ